MSLFYPNKDWWFLPSKAFECQAMTWLCCHYLRWADRDGGYYPETFPCTLLIISLRFQEILYKQRNHNVSVCLLKGSRVWGRSVKSMTDCLFNSYNHCVNYTFSLIQLIFLKAKCVFLKCPCILICIQSCSFVYICQINRAPEDTFLPSNINILPDVMIKPDWWLSLNGDVWVLAHSSYLTELVQYHAHCSFNDIPDNNRRHMF